MVSCAYPNCNSSSGSSVIDNRISSRITFHRFPRNPTLRKIWVKFVDRKNWEPSKYSVLCSKHFAKMCFDPNSRSLVRLKDTAMPTLKHSETCSAHRCKSRSDKKDLDVMFHRFPLNDKERLKRWVEAMRIKNWTPTENDRICSLHFEERFYARIDNKLYLLDEAVPSIFDEWPKAGNVLVEPELQTFRYLMDGMEPDATSVVSVDTSSQNTESSQIIGLKRKLVHEVEKNRQKTKTIKTLNEKLRRRRRKIAMLNQLLKECRSKNLKGHESSVVCIKKIVIPCDVEHFFVEN